jgi:uncharacterized membrane protein (UPF0127 family)
MLMNARTADVVATGVELADTRRTRRKGLLGRESFEPSSALILLPCFSVHTAFMKFPIDVVFIDREGVVVRMVPDLAPWRVAATWRAHAVVEFGAGALRARDIRVGDRLYLAAQAAPEGSVVSWPITA